MKPTFPFRTISPLDSPQLAMKTCQVDIRATTVVALRLFGMGLVVRSLRSNSPI